MSGKCHKYLTRYSTRKPHMNKLVKEEIRKFDDDDIELIDALIRVFSTILGVKGNVVLLDRDQWAEMIDRVKNDKEREKTFLELNDALGMSDWLARAMYLNPRILKKNYLPLISTIIHELIHIGYPKMTEDQVWKQEMELTGRRDSKPIYRLGYD